MCRYSKDFVFIRPVLICSSVLFNLGWVYIWSCLRNKAVGYFKLQARILFAVFPSIQEVIYRLYFKLQARTFFAVVPSIQEVTTK